MPQFRHIIDNQHTTAADYLRGALADAKRLSLVSAYFSVYGFEALQGVLTDLDEVRFLYGDRSSIEDVDPNQESKAFELKDGALSPSHALTQRALARECAAWVGRDGVQVRAITRSNFMHGKMYLADGDETEPKGLVGSSNFTKSGLGAGMAGNMEINLAVEDPRVLEELRQWFDEVWDSDRTEDVKDQLLAELARVGANHSPRDVYFKTLYEIFRAEIENDALKDFEGRVRTLKESAIWNQLYRFQQDGALNTIRRLEDYGGCILADSVGLGKTYTALAAIKYYELRNLNVLVLCPKKLEQNWKRYQVTEAMASNPFRSDRFGYALRAHTDLSRELADFNWSNFDLLVIDESHNFRNRLGKRYEKLLESAIRSGSDTKVLMLSATPVNTKLEDLGAQIGLMTGGTPDTLAPKLGLRNVTGVLSQAEVVFSGWQGQKGSEPRNKDELVNDLGADFKLLLDRVSIARSRKHLIHYYNGVTQSMDDFPKRLKPIDESPHTDLNGDLSYKQIAQQIEKFQLAIYRPSHYVLSASVSDRNTQTYLVQMIKVNFLKRLESSARSLFLTLERTIKKMDTVLNQVERFENNQAIDPNPEIKLSDTLDDDTEDTLAPIHVGKLEYNLFTMDLGKWKPVLQQDKRLLEDVLKEVRKIGPDRDGKLAALKRAISDRHAKPTYDKQGAPNRKLIVFTTFKDTAEYLYRQLKPDMDERKVNFAMVAGDAVQASKGRSDFQDVLSRFSPKARHAEGVRKGSEIDLLIATDCISEGQDLQDCDRIINYDIHWNPVRLTQRFGRIDRIRSKAKDVQMTNYWPTADMEEQIDLKRRVVSRAALVDITATADYNPLSDDADADTITYRDAQLRAMRNEPLDIEDLDDVVSLSDFTLDHFRAQLAQFMEQHKAMLDQMPLGVYAVTPAELKLGDGTPTMLEPGVIWCFRHVNTDASPGTVSPSPVFPCYLTYILDSGDRRYGCANAERVLKLFEDACSDRPEPLQDLCDIFDMDTDHGRNMGSYNELLREGLTRVRDDHTKDAWSRLVTDNPGLVLPLASDTPKSDDDLELVSWLVIRE